MSKNELVYVILGKNIKYLLTVYKMERDRVNNSEEYKVDHQFTLDVL